MSVLRRLFLLLWWFSGDRDDVIECTDGSALCGWCGDELGPDGCDRCAELDARSAAFFDA